MKHSAENPSSKSLRDLTMQLIESNGFTTTRREHKRNFAREEYMLKLIKEILEAANLKQISVRKDGHNARSIGISSELQKKCDELFREISKDFEAFRGKEAELKKVVEEVNNLGEKVENFIREFYPKDDPRHDAFEAMKRPVLNTSQSKNTGCLGVIAVSLGLWSINDKIVEVFRHDRSSPTEIQAVQNGHSTRSPHRSGGGDQAHE